MGITLNERRSHFNKLVAIARRLAASLVDIDGGNEDEEANAIFFMMRNNDYDSVREIAEYVDDEDMLVALQAA